jgi:hypothetical protein
MACAGTDNSIKNKKAVVRKDIREFLLNMSLLSGFQPTSDELRKMGINPG